jgi:hypothetical protein
MKLANMYLTPNKEAVFGDEVDLLEKRKQVLLAGFLSGGGI